MERFIYQELFQSILYNIVTDSEDYGGTYENETFVIRDYDWENDSDQPNFEHKPSGYKLSWYKYPLRSCVSNMELSYDEFASVLYDCLESYYRRKISYDVGNSRWWTNPDYKPTVTRDTPKAITKFIKSKNNISFFCPSCGKSMSYSGEHEYCMFCGQKLSYEYKKETNSEN